MCTCRPVLERYAASTAQEKKLVPAKADLTPDRRLQSSGGAARALYAELIGNLATRSTPDGGALPSVVERFVATAQPGTVTAPRPTETMGLR